MNMKLARVGVKLILAALFLNEVAGSGVRESQVSQTCSAYHLRKVTTVLERRSVQILKERDWIYVPELAEGSYKTGRMCVGWSCEKCAKDVRAYAYADNALLEAFDANKKTTRTSKRVPPPPPSSRRSRLSQGTRDRQGTDQMLANAPPLPQAAPASLSRRSSKAPASRNRRGSGSVSSKSSTLERVGEKCNLNGSHKRRFQYDANKRILYAHKTTHRTDAGVPRLGALTDTIDLKRVASEGFKKTGDKFVLTMIRGKTYTFTNCGNGGNVKAVADFLMKPNANRLEPNQIGQRSFVTFARRRRLLQESRARRRRLLERLQGF